MLHNVGEIYHQDRITYISLINRVYRELMTAQREREIYTEKQREQEERMKSASSRRVEGELWNSHSNNACFGVLPEALLVH